MKRFTFGFLLLAGLLLAAVFLNIVIGSVSLRPGQALAAAFGRGDGVGETERLIVRGIRLPRLLAAALLGGGLAVSGFLLQTFFANPIAGPFVLGISSGARLAVALALIAALGRGVVLSSAGMILAAFAGALLCMGFVLAISGRVRRLSLLVLCGVMVGYICAAVTDIVVTFADDSNIVNLHAWSLGSFSGIGWGGVRALTAVTVPCLLLSLSLSKPMGAYLLGEEYAASMGVNVRLFRLALILLSSLLSACVAAFAGPVSFVGIAVPHLVRSLFGTSRPAVILPGAFLGGAVFCLACDLLARTLFAPTELGISSVTAVFGVPVVLWVLLRRRGREA